jgi:acyl-CoA synthetase (AMP-forming)/AMP-acid ligase II
MVIVDPDTCQLCTPDQIGELWIAGPAVAQGYWNKPVETAETFNAHLSSGEGPFLRTGDLCFIKDGEIYVVGRIKDIIIVHGRNLSAIDFELVAGRAHPSLQPGMAAAFGIPVEGEEKVVIMHETRPDQENVDVEEVARQIRRAVSDELKVSLYSVMLVKPGSLPRTGSGKIQRYLCRNRYLESLSDQNHKEAG